MMPLPSLKVMAPDIGSMSWTAIFTFLALWFVAALVFGVLLGKSMARITANEDALDEIEAEAAMWRSKDAKALSKRIV